MFTIACEQVGNSGKMGSLASLNLVWQLALCHTHNRLRRMQAIVLDHAFLVCRHLVCALGLATPRQSESSKLEVCPDSS